MPIYRIAPVLEPFLPMTFEEDKQDWTYWHLLKETTSLAEGWKPPRLRFFRPGESGVADDQKLTRADTDCPLVPGLALALSCRAYEHLKDFLGINGEPLPVNCSSGDYIIYHCRRQLDALDVERATGSRSYDGRLLSVKTYAFHHHVLKGHDVFRIVGPNPYEIFATENVLRAAESASLRGLRFEKVP